MHPPITVTHPSLSIITVFLRPLLSSLHFPHRKSAPKFTCRRKILQASSSRFMFVTTRIS
ncbi:hypothetical protein HanXRQr2_Chr02g0049771 [Helianthus annuus]|uniref:Uncharacterized protein n=1 Tax=Helianthus annuus TaxID=4232 RepID=A0A251STD6_HELAN|nr:hypothetical protein HanXRQr2_Chr02g0049771 [Helianthus annuus]KAJ0950522.1 hypothetical protein HanPSC8_Chr02g0049221 [Helianthus annuus]